MNFKAALPANRPALVLAPMQDVTDLPFWRVLHRYGGPDIYFTEYFRVHSTSVPDKPILHAIRNKPSAQPVIAQMIGQDIPALIRTAGALQKENILAIDLNIGCPAPVVCKKSSGGGLLRHLDHLEKIITELRRHIGIPFTLKTRLGFSDIAEFDNILKLYANHDIDALTVHGRTVKEMYRSEVHFNLIAKAVQTMPCPVFANGNIISANIAVGVAKTTGAAGLMIGRGCIRNPWLFDQIRELYANGEVRTRPTLRNLREYIDILWRETKPEGFTETLQVAKMKKYMNFIVQKIAANDDFVRQIRRADSEKNFFQICDRFLNSDTPFDSETPEKALVNAGNPRIDCY
jgi:nifR3 family TIM-barrel protein